MPISESEKIYIENGQLSAVIDCRGAQLKSLKKDGVETLWQGDKRFWTETAPVLFPICGGLKDDTYILGGKQYSLQKHGFACNLEFEGQRISAESARFILRSDKYTLEKYPYEFIFTVTFTLHDNMLRTEYKVKNMNERDMYYSVGAHEGFVCKEGIEACSVVFDRQEKFETCVVQDGLLSRKKQKILSDGNTIDLKEEYFTVDALIFENVNSDSVTLINHKNPRKITVEFKDFENLLIWTVPGAGYVCIEPWSGFPDYIDTDKDFTKKTAIQKILPYGTAVKTHIITID